MARGSDYWTALDLITSARGGGALDLMDSFLETWNGLGESRSL